MLWEMPGDLPSTSGDPGLFLHGVSGGKQVQALLWLLLVFLSLEASCKFFLTSIRRQPLPLSRESTGLVSTMDVDGRTAWRKVGGREVGDEAPMRSLLGPRHHSGQQSPSPCDTRSPGDIFPLHSKLR